MTISAQPVCVKCGVPLPGGTGECFCTRCLFARLAKPLTKSKARIQSDDTGQTKAAESGPSDGAMPRHISGYELLGTIAEGGMGIVYRAKDRRVHRTVALKM